MRILNTGLDLIVVAHQVADRPMANMPVASKYLMSSMPIKAGTLTGWLELAPWRSGTPACMVRSLDASKTIASGSTVGIGW